ncbi:Lrp/AsnC family transcriptional regulator [Cellulomonas sp. ATA003]|uniref:Lrp/AsnC family transcriptional regulator n=1 Tax=Cellulomonas sp. ATA003 TaxID=3073064 RepID=UPI0028733779|nr:Lrp/AsnC family transcriptional regulator [Cellulomonas sp. ATA003]WNB86506.1 Lrp/AsnC family transcriptional regulator [Cellulomonas sp. ATA003]
MSRQLAQLDDLDTRIVVALQQDGRASWRKVAEAVDSPITTVARRGQQLLADGVVKVTAVPALGAHGAYDNFLVRINCTPGTHADVAAALVARPDVRFCTIVTGKFDIFAELVVYGGVSRYPGLMTDLHGVDGVERSRSDLILSVYKVTHDWSRQLSGRDPQLPDAVDPSELGRAEPTDVPHLDAADWAILDRLQQDGRDTFQAVADSVGLNESSVRRRFDRMRSAGWVDIVTLARSAALGMGTETLVTVQVAPSRLDAVARALAAHRSVRYLAALLDDNSLFCEVITTSAAELHRFFLSTLAQLEGVQGWNAAMELVFLKRGGVETPWWRAQLEQDGTDLPHPVPVALPADTLR